METIAAFAVHLSRQRVRAFRRNVRRRHTSRRKAALRKSLFPSCRGGAPRDLEPNRSEIAVGGRTGHLMESTHLGFRRCSIVPSSALTFAPAYFSGLGRHQELSMAVRQSGSERSFPASGFQSVPSTSAATRRAEPAAGTPA